MKVMGLFLLCVSVSLQALTYDSAVKKIHTHELIQAGEFATEVNRETIQEQDSWEDPIVKIAAKNYPRDTFSNNQSPMTGIEFGISQKIPLTDKYTFLKNSYTNLLQASEYSVKKKREFLLFNFWKLLIERKKLLAEIEILKNNKEWIEKNLRVSKRLYTIGKSSQQAILEIQIRKSELASIIANKEYELSKIKEEFIYLTGEDEIEENSIPWTILPNASSTIIDYKELELEEMLKAQNNNAKATNLNIISDLTLSLNYTQRSNIDNVEDFVGAAISFPIPVFEKKKASYRKSLHKESQILQEYELYKKEKSKEIELKKKEIQKIMDELNVIEDEILGFAKDARNIVAKSYGVGKATYIELLQSELHLQNILLKKVLLESKRDVERVSLKYLKGELLDE